MFGKKKKDNPLARYEDPIGGFSSRDLRIATWYISHKEKIQAILVLTFGSIAFVLFLYGVGMWIFYASVGYPQDVQTLEQLPYEFQNYEAQHVRYGAKIVTYGTLQIFQSGTDVYDFVIDATNPNEQWIAEVSYFFQYTGGQTAVEYLTLLPQTTQPLSVLGHTLSGQPRNSTFHVEQVTWKRIDPHVISDVPEYLSSRNIFTVQDVLFDDGGQDVFGGHRLDFTVTNNSLFSYWSPSFYVSLQDGERRVGVARIQIDQFMTSTTVPIQLRIFRDDFFADSVRLYPLINFFDQDEFME